MFCVAFLRRAVRYGRTLGFHEPFFFKLVDVVAKTMGDVFPEVRTQQSKIKETIRREEEAFNKTLDRGIELFDREVARILGSAGASPAVSRASRDTPDESSRRNVLQASASTFRAALGKIHGHVYHARASETFSRGAGHHARNHFA